MPLEPLPTAPLALEAAALAAPARYSPRFAIAATFLAFGVAFGLWAGSSAAILARTGLGALAFGLLLSSFTGAYLPAMSGANVIARRLTVKRTLIAAMLAIIPVLGGLLAAFSPLTLGIGLLAYGTLAGALDATMNAEGARIEKRLGVPILARLHGGASAGTACGAIVGSVLATSTGNHGSAKHGFGRF
jgi:MFS family permease